MKFLDRQTDRQTSWSWVVGPRHHSRGRIRVTKMKGWKEDELADKRLMAPCGLYCGSCGIYISKRDGNTRFRDSLARLYGTRPEETECLGCMQEDPPEC
jgi:hypothetical protein